MNDLNQQAAAPAAPASSGTTVCITAKPDGTFTVYQDGDESQPGATEDEGAEMDGGQSAPDIDSALQMAKQMLGGAPSDQGSGQDDAEALFQGGFSGARSPLNKG